MPVGDVIGGWRGDFLFAIATTFCVCDRFWMIDRSIDRGPVYMKCFAEQAAASSSGSLRHA